MPCTAVPMVTTGTRSSCSEMTDGSASGTFKASSPSTRLASDLVSSPRARRSPVRPNGVEQQVVTLLGRDLLDALDDGGKEPAGHPGRDQPDRIGTTGGQRCRRWRGKYPSCCAASSTASRVLADTPGRPRSARDTVAGENPDNAATSTMPAGSNGGPDMAFCLPILFPAQPLTPPASSPRTKYRCRPMNTANGTTIEMNAPADSNSH